MLHLGSNCALSYMFDIDIPCLLLMSWSTFGCWNRISSAPATFLPRPPTFRNRPCKVNLFIFYFLFIFFTLTSRWRPLNSLNVRRYTTKYSKNKGIPNTKNRDFLTTILPGSFKPHVTLLQVKPLLSNSFGLIFIHSTFVTTSKQESNGPWLDKNVRI